MTLTKLNAASETVKFEYQIIDYATVHMIPIFRFILSYITGSSLSRYLGPNCPSYSRGLSRITRLKVNQYTSNVLSLNTGRIKLHRKAVPITTLSFLCFSCSSPAEVQGAAVYTINMSFFHCTDVAKRASERALAIGLGVVIGLIIAMIATLVVYRLVFKARRRARDGTLTVSASSPYSRVDSRELVLKGDDI